MGKIDYSKAEREIHDALQRMRVKELAEGRSVTSRRAADFFGLSQDTPRPASDEAVSKLVREEAAQLEEEPKRRKEEEARKLAEQKAALEGKAPPQPKQEKEPAEDAFEVIRKTPVYDVLRKARSQSDRPPRFAVSPPSDVPPSDMILESSSPLYVLRQHVLWLKRHHKDNRYELLGTTRSEIMALRTAQRLSEEQLVRIKEINARAEEIRAEILASKGSDEGEIEDQKKKQKTKRFNVKDTWLHL